jgi:hypothetical protein
MNITKRMLRFGVAALAMAIGSQALAAPIISESFEGTNGVGWASGTLVTNLPTSAWSSTGGDLSVITNMGYTYTPYADATLPLTSDTHTNVVQLATEGGMLSLNGASVSFDPSAGPVYVDTMVRFVLSDSDPTESSITNDTKIAIFANSSSNLVIRHGVQSEGFVVTNSVTTTVIDPAVWYRLTVTLSDDGSSFARAQVQVNSNIVTHANAEGPDKSLFRSARTDDFYLTLEAVSFQGSGFIDDVVVTRDPPTFVATASVFSYVIDEYIDGSHNQYITVSTENQYAAGWTNVYAAPSDPAWFTNRVDVGTDTIFSPLGADGGTVTSPAPWQVTITTNVLKMQLNQPKAAGELPARFDGMSPNLIAYIRGFGMTPNGEFDSDANNPAFEQAMKLNPYVNEAVTNVITSLTVGTPNSTIVVKVTTNGVAYASASDLTLNILIDSKMSLTNVWPTAAGITNELKYLNVLGETNITFATSSGQFFRTRIVPQQ